MTAETSFSRPWWTLILGVMAACLSLAVAGLPLYKGSSSALGLFGGLVAAAGFVSPRLLPSLPGWGRRIANLAIPLLLALGLSLVGPALPASSVPLLWAVPLSLLMWFAAGSVAADLARSDRTSDGEVVASTISRLEGNFLVGLVLLFLLLSLGTSRLAFLLAGLYVAAGMSGLAWLRYSARRRQWDRGGAELRGGLGRRWLLSGVVLLALVAILAALMPTSLVLAVALLVWHALGPIVAQPVISWVSRTAYHWRRITGGAFGRIHHYGKGGHPPKIHKGHGHALTGNSLVEIMLWVGAAVVVAYLAQAYWRHRFQGVPWRIALLGPILTVWARLRFILGWSLDAINVHLPDQIAVLLPGATAALPGASRRRFGRLSPRERIALYYLGVLRRARHHGVPCPPWTTPQEYLLVLGPRVGDARGNLVELSEVFVEARYSLHDLSSDVADQARADARRVREALRIPQEPRPPASPRADPLGG